MQKFILGSLALAFGASAASVVPLPGLKGPYKVGTSVLELVDSSRNDPFAPTVGPRDLAISLFYPTQGEKQQPEDCTAEFQFPPLTVAFINAAYNDTGGAAGRIVGRSCLNTPLSHPELPLLFFSPGQGNPRTLYSAELEEIASHGWNVISVDHPYDSAIVEYPNNRAVYAAESPVANPTMDEYLEVRVADMRFVLDALSKSSIVSKIPGLAGKALRTDKAGVFGHSFGGATALQLLLNDTRFAVGANFDGTLFGSVIEEGTDAPFALFGTETRAADKTWIRAWENLGGFKRQYAVKGTEHGAFTDSPIFRDVLGPDAPAALSSGLGTIAGERIIRLETAYLDALFGRFLKGERGRLLDRKCSRDWPEVSLVKRN